ncbi:oxysterol-binding protein-related protein 10-like isoform X2 [Brienomyrus brachyistius]|uniref:oxysterol-binding protein-related protein 10-like isoform X2 n=1 Tax=Brienomyrus brachyistius TaxID=42636 RepID=UPI0020B23FE8|nr:oxysterol-binding protein-related protein 10-like isoform X2 [Brienomyrus brachyistius]
MEKNGIDKTFSKADRGKAARNYVTGESRSPASAPGGVPASRGADVRGAPGSGSPGQQADPRRVEGLLRKYTNLVQGWQHRYFVLDTDCGQLRYFISEPGEGQKPRGSLPLPGAMVRPSDEGPYTFSVLSAAGQLYKLRAANAREQHFWMNHLLASTRWHSNGSTEVGKWRHPDGHSYVEGARISQDGQGSSSSGWPGSLTLLTAGSPPPGILRPPSASAVSRGIVTIIHNKSPDFRNRYPRRLQEVQEVMNQAEGKQKSLVHSIESLPTCGPVSCLDQDLLLLKATSTATLDCLGECLSILQQRAAQAAPLGPPSPGQAPPFGGVHCIG